MNTRTLGAALTLISAMLFSMPVQSDDARPFVRGTWQQIRSAYAGKPVAIHFWGVSCAPCRAEMPVWGQLVKDRPDLKLVTIHADRQPQDARALPQMLADAGLSHVEGWKFAERFVEPLRFEIDPDWQGEIPMTILIGRNGGIQTIIGSIEDGQIRSWLDEQRSSTQ